MKAGSGYARPDSGWSTATPRSGHGPESGISQSAIARLEPCSRRACRSRTLARLAAALHVQPATLTPDGPPVSRPRVTSGQTAGATIWPDALPNSIREPSGPGADPDSVTVSPSAR